MDIFYNILAEVAVFLFFAALYYFFQKRKIYFWIDKELRYAVEELEFLTAQAKERDYQNLSEFQRKTLDQLIENIDLFKKGKIKKLDQELKKDIEYSFTDEDPITQVVVEFSHCLFYESDEKR